MGFGFVVNYFGQILGVLCLSFYLAGMLLVFLRAFLAVVLELYLCSGLECFLVFCGLFEVFVLSDVYIFTFEMGHCSIFGWGEALIFV